MSANVPEITLWPSCAAALHALTHARSFTMACAEHFVFPGTDLLGLATLSFLYQFVWSGDACDSLQAQSILLGQSPNLALELQVRPVIQD